MSTIRFPYFRHVIAAPTQVSGPADGLDVFNAETNKAGPLRQPPHWIKPLMLVAITVAGALSGVWAYQAYAVAAAMASLSIESTPPGALVMVDGGAMGQTPTAMNLPPGTYGVRLTAPGGQERQLEVTLRSGESVVHQIEWAPPPAAVPTSGALHVQTEPAGQAVFVDDVQRGISPTTVTDLSPGDHAVHVTGSAGTIRRQITVTAGETMSLVIAPNTPVVSAGWLRVSSPVLLQLLVNGNLVGNTESDRVMLPSGQHDVEIGNESLGFKVSRRVVVASGRTSELRVAPPSGRLNINAQPWAEVWLNGERVGTTPIANLSWPIGTHSVVLRHPQLGERRARLTVGLKETARLGIDMRQP